MCTQHATLFVTEPRTRDAGRGAGRMLVELLAGVALKLGDVGRLSSCYQDNSESSQTPACKSDCRAAGCMHAQLHSFATAGVASISVACSSSAVNQLVCVTARMPAGGAHAEGCERGGRQLQHHAHGPRQPSHPGPHPGAAPAPHNSSSSGSSNSGSSSTSPVSVSVTLACSRQRRAVGSTARNLV